MMHMTLPFGLHQAARTGPKSGSRLRSAVNCPCRNSSASAPLTKMVEYGMSDIWHNSAMSAENPESKAKSPDSKSNESGKDNTPSEAGGESRAKEVGGRDGPEPTRFGDWEKNGRCVDF